MKIVPPHILATFVGHRIANSGHPDLVQSYGKLKFEGGLR
jgi:hypothetical protein